MGTVHELRPNTDGWLAGEARCDTCGHDWVAVAPVGALPLECPVCGDMKGWYLKPISKSDEPHWRCTCGNESFSITPTGAYCPRCGKDQRW